MDSDPAEIDCGIQSLEDHGFAIQNLNNIKRDNINYKTNQAILKNNNKDCSCRGRPQILIVDDNIFNIIAVQTILESELGKANVCDSALNGE